MIFVSLVLIQIVGIGNLRKAKMLKILQIA